CLQYNTDPYSF
nr:immunoglobulin light chain junction region [Macaca mulatta]